MFALIPRLKSGALLKLQINLQLYQRAIALSRSLPKNYKKLPVSCLIFIDFPGLGPGGHAACFSGVLPDKKIQLDDPLTGTRMLEEEKFLEMWHGQGIKITPEKNKGT